VEGHHCDIRNLKGSFAKWPQLVWVLIGMRSIDPRLGQIWAARSQMDGWRRLLVGGGDGLTMHGGAGRRDSPAKLGIELPRNSMG
jgi:hypothetical protein